MDPHRRTLEVVFFELLNAGFDVATRTLDSINHDFVAFAKEGKRLLLRNGISSNEDTLIFVRALRLRPGRRTTITEFGVA
jgi:hypothetical protein